MINSFNNYIKERFDHPVYKVSVDAGFTCPNRDGAKGYNGCIFCNGGSSARTQDPSKSIEHQILNNIKIRLQQCPDAKFIVYFQSYSNTYASADRLHKLYDLAISVHPDIIGLAISTRPDCVDQEKLSLIAGYQKKLPYVCLEYGMQTIHNHSLRLTNRGENHEDFLKAWALTKQLQIETCVHVILGLPGESEQDQLATADFIAKEKIDGVKIHALVAMRDTVLEQMYYNGEWQPLTYEEYIRLASKFIARLHPQCVIHRLSGNGHPRLIVAPDWIVKNKTKIPYDIAKQLSQLPH